MLLEFGGTVAQAAEVVEADGTGERVSRLALVELRSGLPAQFRPFQPVDGEQGAFDTADLAQSQRQAVLTRVSQ